MLLKKYGVTLKRLCTEDIEMLRNWRNSDAVRQNMEFREYITPEMQQAWFISVNNPNNSYYIIEYEGENVGLIHEKDIDWEHKTCESGLFLKDPSFYQTVIPVLASFILIEIGFYLLNSTRSFIKVKEDNQAAISYNESLGYSFFEDLGQGYLKMILTRESFEKKTEKLRKAISVLYGKDPHFYLILEDADYQENGMGNFVLDLIRRSNAPFHEAVEAQRRVFSFLY